MNAANIQQPQRKDDAGKLPVHRGVTSYFPRALFAVAQVSAFGAKKYDWSSWDKVEDGAHRYADAQQRHALYQAMGQEFDEESGLLHLAHEAWNALARLELRLRNGGDS